MSQALQTPGQRVLSLFLAGFFVLWTSVALAQPDPAQPPPPTEVPPPPPTEPPTPPATEPPAEAQPPTPPKPDPQQKAAPPAAPSVAPTPPAMPTVPPAASPKSGGFAFGSYGRVIAATDFKGRPGRDADVVAHGSRLDESNYVELELRRDDLWEKTHSSTHVVATLAVGHPIFHYNGEFDAKLAIRNLFIEERDLGLQGLSVWAGSRMYRGDDIYLLDWWPLDNLNTLGAGARYAITEKTSAAIQGGLSMPSGSFFNQTVLRPTTLNQFGATSIDVLQRQKFIGSLKASHIIPLSEKAGLKGVVYSELHTLTIGQRQTDPGVFETLPADNGYVIGMQIGAFTGERDTHVNLFLRYARGLAAYGDFATPTQLSTDRTTSGAYEFVAALGGNWEYGPLGVLVASYIKAFRNASPDLDFQDVDEGIIMARPHLFFGEIAGVALEASYQVQQRGVLFMPPDDRGLAVAPTGPLTPSLFRFGIVPFLSPAGRGDFSRPHIRMIWAVTLRNDEARALYPRDDVFNLRNTDFFFGLGAEWWFNSSSYGG